MRTRVLLATCAAFLSASTAVADLQGQPDLHRLQGTWIVTRAEHSGAARHDIAGSVLKIVSDIFYLRTGTGSEYRGTVQLGLGELPKQVDLVLSTGTVWLGIYALENGGLRLNYVDRDAGASRPIAFATTSGGAETLIELRRRGQ